MAISLQDYINQVKTKNQSNLNSLYTQKYGQGNYNANQGWYGQSANPNGNWNTYQEQNALAGYVMAGENQNTINQLQQVSNQFATNQANQNTQANNMQSFIQKYVGNQLRGMGIQSQGIAQNQMQGIQSNYQNQINANKQNRQASEQNWLANYLPNYQQDFQSNQDKYQATLAKYQESFNTTKNQYLEELKASDPNDIQNVLGKYSNLPSEAIAEGQQIIFDKYGVDDNSNSYSIDNQYLITQKGMEGTTPTVYRNQANIAKMEQIKANPQAYEGKIIKFENAQNYKKLTFRDNVTYTLLFHNGKFYQVKDKYDETAKFN
jgi:hypothetical protein